MSNLLDHIRNQPWRREDRSGEAGGISNNQSATREPSLPTPSGRAQETGLGHAIADTPAHASEGGQWRRYAAPPTGDVDFDSRSAHWAAYGRRADQSGSSTSHPRGRSGVGVWRPSQCEHGSVLSPPRDQDRDRTHLTTDWRRSSALPQHRPDQPSTASYFDAVAPPATIVGVQSHMQTPDQLQQFQAYGRTCQQMQNITVSENQCDEQKEYAQWAGRFVEVNERLLARICPCNLVGKPCPFDELEGGCPMIRLCGQLEKWTLHRCPDKGFRTILDAVENIPASYEDRFGTVNAYDSSDSEGGVALSSEVSSEDGGVVVPEYQGKKVSFNDFSCGIQNECGHIHWEVEINCRFVGWNHVKPDTVCKQVREKGRLCSCGHDLEDARQRARDAVREHERMAMRCGAPRPRDLGRVWVY